MIKPICRDVLFLSQKAEPATRSDMQIAQIIQHECNHLNGVII